MPKFFTIEPAKESSVLSMTTACMRECGICGVYVASSGGGSNMQICSPCADDIDSGAIVQFIDLEALRAFRLARGDFNE